VSALADLSHGVNAETAWNYVRDIRRQGVTIESLYANLLQPAARALGDRWQDDRCSEFEVTIGMGRLQEIAHRLSPEATSLPLRTQAPCTILVAPQPGEKHLLGVAIDSECFWQSGAVVDCKFPTSDVGLCDLLHSRWFDILDLSLSDAYRREHWLSAMTETVRLARSASVNPRLVVTVGGRVFREQPDFCGRVGADASHGSARELVSKARIALAARGAVSSNDGSIHASSS
jgi:methanogenic corrinoid protein MtbC1